MEQQSLPTSEDRDIPSGLPSIPVISVVRTNFQGPRCDVCDWNGDPLQIFSETNDGITFKRLLESNEENCARCKILILALKVLSIRFAGAPPGQDAYIKIWSNGWVRFGRVDGDWAAVEIYLATLTGHSEIKFNPSVPNQQPSHCGSLTDGSLTWTKNQIESHRDCWEAHKSGSFVPTRLVNLSTPGFDKDVFLDENVPSGSRYVALSYCWGQYEPLCQTTRSTVNERKKRIPWSTLPKTLQDAIEFTRRLGIQYFWADCICILQGDKEDWEREAGRMFYVYRNSYVTLAAMWGKDGNTGLFSTSISDDFDPTFIAELRLENRRCLLYTRRAHEKYFSMYRRAGKEQPLLTRAWAYQERIISTRVVYFAGYELAFECFCDAICECGHLQHQPTRNESHKRDIFQSVLKHANESINIERQSNEVIQNQRGPLSLQDSNDKDIDVLWRDTVEQYCQLALSNPDDKLPAIGAIAEQFHAVRQGESYLAGLWTGSFHRDLLWRVSYNYNASAQLPKPTNMPSWSWASGDFGWVSYPYLIDMETTSEVIEATCHYVNNNPYGVLERSNLVLRGRLLCCWLFQYTPKLRGPRYSLRHWYTGIKILSGDSIILDVPNYARWACPRIVYLLEIAEHASLKDTQNLRCHGCLILRREGWWGHTFSRLGTADVDLPNTIFKMCSAIKTVNLI
ncbi:heterokaryon incompatibility protein-domain-containing protein [Hypoxylon trugodes]|uniref:heterokaryon incompatibility protein-domain-containing protein n=1 Tax=Hypoxylon trugodes TaxID=326681 RepID=UPI00219F42AB|nr:heterokaryon incompatibility protein-domain-containing protein [Hypoxylon trugodes]KAI1385153.1 heterokaryon incompatibility protein-domain-containing protein [Hypoxylon trugodes]